LFGFEPLTLFILKPECVLETLYYACAAADAPIRRAMVNKTWTFLFCKAGFRAYLKTIKDTPAAICIYFNIPVSLLEMGSSGDRCAARVIVGEHCYQDAWKYERCE
tara:strand:+ start:3708 stop:4025 length:318 start_codon:yes stop_codon:yes gene_type:complete